MNSAGTGSAKWQPNATSRKTVRTGVQAKKKEEEGWCGVPARSVGLTVFRSPVAAIVVVVQAGLESSVHTPTGSWLQG